ncbi:MAG: SPFH domain-containing protein [Thermodesulfobacteriota bacterium]|jgi:regulator of protease activity HflC (stomatin/prohibitin superfamily)
MMMLETIEWFASIVGGFIALILFLRGFCLIRAYQVGILTKNMLGKKMPEGQIIARHGQVGVQAKTLMPGLYWRLPIIWSFRKVPVVTIDIGSIGIVESIDGEALPKGRVLADEVECNQFQDAEVFLANHGKKGPQVGILRPGTYRINTILFNIAKAPAVKIPENTIGVAIAKDGIPLPTGYIIAPKALNVNGTEADHKAYQNGQLFIDSKGYRGPQLETLQPGIYYINPNLFDIKIEEVAEVLPGYVAVIRSNVGLELERAPEGPDRSTGEGKLCGPIHEDVEKILITDKYTRGIWREPIAPGKYNLNAIAFTAYQVPTSAVTIDWASEGRIGTEVKGIKPTEAKAAGVLYSFDPLKVTSKDGFQLEVNVRMVIRIQPGNAAYIIARFGSVANLIDQIVHPLIDSSFRNKAGEKKAIDFFQSRTDLQTEALVHAKERFSEYNVEAQNLLIAYIDIPKDLLDTQTKKEIANQQQAQYDQEALAQEKRIAVMEKSSRADKQKDVIDAKLSIDINNDRAEARAKEADGIRRSVILQAQGTKESTILVADGNSYKSKIEGDGVAAAYNAQKEAIGQQNVAIIKLIQEIAAGKIQIVPQILVGGGDASAGGNLFNAWLAQMLSQKVPKQEGK